ncbi:unnamed protein product [Rhizoctonia solani]|uniref:UDP-glycosyltransferase 74C1 n=1 Tax=Rhizoctonia solani TaxID=456999 RepID=A0A8H3H4P5_9AGAM|nr:unnamed protein product [Rhizoctonia solani]
MRPPPSHQPNAPPCSMTFTPLKHIVFIPGPPWGHLRPGLKTALRMTEKFPDLFISLFVYSTEVSKATKYLNAQPSAFSRRVRLVTAASNEGDPAMSPGNEIEMLNALESAFGLWMTKEVQQPTIVQVDGRPINQPSMIIEDVFSGGVGLACKDVHQLPIVAWWLMSAASLISIVGDGRDAQDVDISEKTIQGDKSTLTETGQKYSQDNTNRLISIPGVPPFYEWEAATQDLPFMKPFMGYMMGRFMNMLKHAEAVICCTAFEYEPITASAISSALKVAPFFIGPSVDVASPHQPDPNSPVTQFLDRAYTEQGAHSVIYIAFGTFFFPPPSSMSLLMAAVDEIPKAGFKFIFALSSERAQIDQAWIDAHVQAGNAIFPEWTNQTAVLEHPAIHYFLSHGGWNSSTEAIGDQPLDATQIANVHDCGFELLQVRTGPAKSVAYQNGTDVKIVGTEDAVREEMKRILALSKGSRGEHQRTNMRLLGKVVADSLAPGGSGDMGLDRFGKALGLA